MEPLTIYEKHPTADAYRVGGFWSPYCIVSREKRFTDAELAAEVWRQEASVTTVEAMGGKPIRTLKALNTLHRFATNPHFDEES